MLNILVEILTYRPSTSPMLSNLKQSRDYFNTLLLIDFGLLLINLINKRTPRISVKYF